MHLILCETNSRANFVYQDTDLAALTRRLSSRSKHTTAMRKGLEAWLTSVRAAGDPVAILRLTGGATVIAHATVIPVSVLEEVPRVDFTARLRPLEQGSSPFPKPSLSAKTAPASDGEAAAVDDHEFNDEPED